MTRTANPDIAKWNRKYTNKSHEASLVSPVGEPELVKNRQYIKQILNTRRQAGTRHDRDQSLALDLACGTGANALYLASLGFQVIPCDGAYLAIEKCQASAKAHNLKIFPLVCDLESIVLPVDAFDLICVVRYLQRSLFENLTNAVQPGGIIFYKTFNTYFLIQNPRFNPDFVVEPGELDSIFRDFEILDSDIKSGTKDSYEIPTTSYVIARKSTQ